MEGWKDGPQPISRAPAKARQRAGRCPYPTLRTTTLLLPVWGNGGVDGGQEAPAARQGGSAARIADITDIATSASGAAPRGFPREGSSARGGPGPAAVHPGCIPRPHPKTPPQAPGFAPLSTTGFNAKRSSGLFLSQKHARFPLEAKGKKASFSRSVQKAKFLPRNISERSGVPLPVAPASSRTHFPLFILKIFLR